MIIAAILATTAAAFSLPSTAGEVIVSETNVEDESIVIVGGVVENADSSIGKLRVQQEGAKELDMPAMSMVFRALNAQQLEYLKAGDRVQMHVRGSADKYFLVDNVKIV